MRHHPASVETIPYLRSDNLAVSHGFFGCQGGVSKGLYASLNCGPGSKDAPENVAENRRRVLETLGISAATLIKMHQTHSTDVITLTSPIDEPIMADAVITQQQGIALSVLTADCVPILCHAPDIAAIAAIHSGWRGAFDGILENTVFALNELGAKAANLIIAIGPCIEQNSYQVGSEFRQRFVVHSADSDRFFLPCAERPHHYRFDLAGYVVSRLQSLGVKNIITQGEDTVSQPTRYFSYRRNTLEGISDYGRNISVICLASS